MFSTGVTTRLNRRAPRWEGVISSVSLDIAYLVLMPKKLGLLIALKVGDYEPVQASSLPRRTRKGLGV